MEGKGLAEGNSPERNALRTHSREGAQSALERVRQAVRRGGRRRFTALLHHVYDIDRLRTAYYGLKRDAAAGVDRETWRAYGEHLEANLQDLADRLRRGAYRAKPVRRAFFDTLSHEWLARFVEHRIAGRRVVHLIQKWLRAGGLEDGQQIVSEIGTVQGGSISPLLANLYLHHVFDLWVRRWRKRQARGDVVVVRFADDFVVGFQHRQEAERFLADLRERFAKFGLELHPDKTRLIPFGRFAGKGGAKPPTFNLPRIQAQLRKDAEGRLHRPATDDAPEVAGEAEGGESRTQATHAPAHPGAGVPTCGLSSPGTSATTACP